MSEQNNPKQLQVNEPGRHTSDEGRRIITKADDIYLWHSEGKRYGDAISGLWCVNVGLWPKADSRSGLRPVIGAALLQ